MIRLLEYAFLMAIVLTTVTQLIIPSINGTKMFPVFSKKRRALSNEATDLLETLDTFSIERDVKELRKEVTAQTTEESSSDSK